MSTKARHIRSVGGRFALIGAAASLTLDSVLRAEEASATITPASVLRSGEATATMTPSSVLRAGDSAMMRWISLDPVIHGRANLAKGTENCKLCGEMALIIIFNWDDDDDDDDDGDDDSAVEMAPLERIQRLLSFFKVEEGHVPWENGCKHTIALF